MPPFYPEVPLSSVTSYLRIPLDRCSSFKQVYPLDYRIISISGSCFKHCSVEPPFLIRFFMIGKKAQLVESVTVHYFTGTYTDPAI